MMDRLCRDLKVKIKRIGSSPWPWTKGRNAVFRLREQGEANGVPGLEIVGPERMHAIQPGVEGDLSLYSRRAPSSPYGLTIGLAENAVTNGAHFHLGQKVTSLTPP